MTRTTLAAAVTAAVLGSLTLTATAEAGGLRLGFGGPMASFVATPTHGGSGYSAPSKYGRGAHCAKKSSPSYTVASRSQAQPKVAQHDKADVAKTAKDTEKVAEKVSNSSDTAADSNSNGLTGSKALVQTDNAATAATAGETANLEAAKTEAVTVAQAPETAAEVKADETDAKDVGCKKFIPSVGVTIDVGCEK